MKVKICGITNIDDALKASYYGAWALGFIFHKQSPRYVSPSRASKIISGLPPFITPVGVFVDLSERAVRDICRFTGIRTVQLHGEEKPEYCHRFKGLHVIKAFRVSDDFDFSLVARYKQVNAYLFDAYDEGRHGGTGKTFNWKLISLNKINKPLILSGGLNSANIKEAIDTVRPYAVDVSSAVEEKPGIKNHRLMRALFDTFDCAKPTHL